MNMVNMRNLQQELQREEAEGFHAGVIVAVDIVIVTIVIIFSGSVSGGRNRIKNKILARKK